MSVLGIGLDVVDLTRFRRTLDDLGDSFVDRIFTPDEVSYADRSPRRRHERLGARFAAKEAFGKATGLGMSNKTSWRDIEVDLDARGRPVLRLHGKAEQTAREMGVEHTHLSLSHDGDVAAALVVLEGGNP